MIDKNTDKLMNELKDAKNIDDYLRDNAAEMRRLSLSDYLYKILAEKNMKRTTVVKNSGLDPSYVYHIFNGDKNPSRNKMLAIAFGLKATVDETQHMLRQSKQALLYPRDKWDAIIISALRQGLTVVETNELLEKLGETSFLE